MVSSPGSNLRKRYFNNCQMYAFFKIKDCFYILSLLLPLFVCSGLCIHYSLGFLMGVN